MRMMVMAVMMTRKHTGKSKNTPQTGSGQSRQTPATPHFLNTYDSNS
jgi:hypothetical protein